MNYQVASEIIYDPQPRDWTLVWKIVSLDWIKWAFNFFHKCKFGVPDGITSALVIEGIDVLDLHIRNIPITCRSMKVMLIPKRRKPTYMDAESFRRSVKFSFYTKSTEKIRILEIRTTEILIRSWGNSSNAASSLPCEQRNRKWLQVIIAPLYIYDLWSQIRRGCKLYTSGNHLMFRRKYYSKVRIHLMTDKINWKGGYINSCVIAQCRQNAYQKQIHGITTFYKLVYEKRFVIRKYSMESIRYHSFFTFCSDVGLLRLLRSYLLEGFSPFYCDFW